MHNGPNQPSRPGRNRRRRRGRSGPAGQPGGHKRQRGTPFTGPMDHSYRNQPAGGGHASGGQGQRYGGYQAQRYHQPAAPEVEPLALAADAPTRILAVIDDLFFLAKIQETARKINVKVDYAKTDKDVMERAETNGDQKLSLIIFDLNNTGAKPLSTIPKLKSKMKGTSIIGFLSHVQGDLKVKAQQAGCDAVMPRSAFSQNLAQILRRHGAPDDLEQDVE